MCLSEVMQPPNDPNPSLQDSVVGGDLHTGHVIHNHYHMPQQSPPAPQRPPIPHSNQQPQQLQYHQQQVTMQQPVQQYQQPQQYHQHPGNIHATGPNKDVLVAYLLWFFLGPLGVHRFYLNHIGMGLLNLFTFGGCGILWLIDAILIPDLVRRENRVYIRN